MSSRTSPWPQGQRGPSRTNAVALGIKSLITNTSPSLLHFSFTLLSSVNKGAYNYGPEKVQRYWCLVWTYFDESLRITPWSQGLFRTEWPWPSSHWPGTPCHQILDNTATTTKYLLQLYVVTELLLMQYNYLSALCDLRGLVSENQHKQYSSSFSEESVMLVIKKWGESMICLGDKNGSDPTKACSNYLQQFYDVRRPSQAWNNCRKEDHLYKCQVCKVCMLTAYTRMSVIIRSVLFNL